ncbi:MAG: metabolite traffic protein EboE [Symploca sp. SIO2D2]|nr:metabolite traffic protein EboE [Symploca sp. SIO2D2]NER47499.1 metabolite traffic protein EboE [Symploca sp. SIO1A3]
MKIGTNGSFHLTYCTNIHPGETWDEVFSNLQQYLPVLKTRLSPQAPFGIGLRLADVAARELLTGDNLAQFQDWLNQQDLYVFTLNGFPYGGFHQQVVKDQVYAPDWSTPERVEYTLRLARILAALLPAGMEGSISTLPLSYKPWWKTDTARESVMSQCSLNLAKVAAEMARIREETGKLLHIDLEPEPDGLIENAAEVIDFFQNWLLPQGGAYLAQHRGISSDSAASLLREHVQICYDTCHFAVEYEEPASVFEGLQAAGIRIGKIQLSAALQIQLPDDIPGRQLLRERLSPFAESTYLHQVIERHSDGSLSHYPDLVSALPYLEQTQATEWRTHFHVPIFIRDYQILQSTQEDIVSVLKLLQAHDHCKHLEIETYTWGVLPAEMKLDILASIQREYEWVLSNK